MNGRLLTRRTVPALVAALATLGLAPSALGATASVSGSELIVTGGIDTDVVSIRFDRKPTADGGTTADKTALIVSGTVPGGSSAPSIPVVPNPFASGCTSINAYDVRCTSKSGEFQTVDATMLGAGADYFSPTIDPLPLIMKIDGGEGADYLKGGDGADTVTGGAGNDQIFGRGGADRLVPGTGADDVYGGGGGPTDAAHDLVDLSANDAGLVITLDNEFNDTDANGDQPDNIHSDVEDIVVGDGNDSVDMSGSNVSDNLIVGNGGADTITSGAGNDTVAGGFGSISRGALTTSSTADPAANQIFAGSGNDTVTSSTGGDTIEGQDGDDTIDAGAGVNSVGGGEGSDRITTGGGNDDVRGGGGADDITAGNGDNTIAGGDGGDVITSGTGKDAVTGDAGADKIGTGDGDDTISGGLDADDMDAGAGAGDTISYAEKTQPVYAKIADEFVSGTYCGDKAAEGQVCEGDKVVGAESLIGGSAGDHLIGNEAINSLSGRDGADHLEGLAADDALAGGDGNDKLEGLAGNDALKGDGGDDNLEGGAGADDIVGGTGTDFVSYRLAAAAVTVTLDDNQANDGVPNEGDNIHEDIESVEGSAYDDSLRGSDGPNTLLGLGGRDTLTGLGGTDALDGGDGDDMLDGSGGADSLDGAGGTDLATYATRAGAVTVTLDDVANDGESREGDNVSSATENVTTGNGGDTIIGNSADNVLSGGSGEDIIDGGRGADEIQGGDDTDTVVFGGRPADEAVWVSLNGAPDDGMRVNADSEGDNVRPDVENITTGPGNDVVEGSPRANTIVLGDGNDRVLSGPGADRIEAGAGNDDIDGGAGNDSIQPGTGADMVVGGADDDEFDYSERTAPVSVTFDNVANDGEDREGDNVRDAANSGVKGPAAAPPTPESAPVTQPRGETTTGSSSGTQTVNNPTTEQKQGSVLFASAKQISGRRVLIRGKILVKARNGLAQSAAACRGGGRVVVTVRKGTTVVGRKRASLTRTCSFRAPVTLARGATGRLRVEVRFLGNRALKASRRTTNLQVNG